ncbi:lipid droplet-associated hydrolase isoform X4 [Amborella trichopoda]|uniref:lipid droplet-associated hydrolase isoform X4 n=1 Tax=Amborella trichopoda TaxID=13333 RepID=UPI0009BEE78C|nr:lipid droplet-associated hydrolase isoform X4 [Amborella trichopoda]|eukprot:XP_020529363.1 lipid droplet-associated hydrolase isoform X4 [Amborella trichopoda]
MPLLSAYPFRCYPTRCEMGRGFSRLQWKKQAQLRLCNVSGFITELIEVHCDRPLLHVLFIPGNPGVVSFYKEFVEAIYGQLDEKASITAIGHISHTEKNWEKGRLFSLQEQIDHKIEFVDRQLQNSETPIVLVGHSIGSHISLEIFRRFPDKVAYCIGLYPFLTLNKESYQQIFIGTIAMSPILSTIISSLAALFGLLPNLISASLVKRSVGCSWSSSAVTATCTHLLKYHTVRNALFMAMTEFGKFSEEPDWTFIRRKGSQISFLFGIDDHWGPLSMFEEISKQAPGVSQSLEEEGHTHAFSCTEAGSVWVACHVVNLIKNQIFGLTLPARTLLSLLKGFGSLCVSNVHYQENPPKFCSRLYWLQLPRIEARHPNAP